MKKVQIMALLMGIAVFAFQAGAYAEIVSGKVASVDAATGSLSITTKNAETQADEKVIVSIKQETAFSGVQALTDLKEGQEVSANVSKDEASGNWNAQSVEVKAAEEAPAAY